MKMQQPVLVEVRKRFSANPEQVFDAWFDKEMVSEWMFGARVRSEEIISLLSNPVVGGYFSYVVSRNGMELEHVGEYLEIDRPRCLMFTWGVKGQDSSKVMVNILSDQGGSELVLTHEIASEWGDHADEIKRSWSHMLEVLNEVLDERESESPRD